ncbi:unnamed protein product [Angiostrongylus costaricensis]|uniref:Uncharacterized protein n=1 Tax=Angiostrongylus costaricensis TaxID=334426 RepID=A0A158PEW7_ANGCS|nr:unnamed protein product [Angiostrongylus costaricensis]
MRILPDEIQYYLEITSDDITKLYLRASAGNSSSVAETGSSFSEKSSWSPIMNCSVPPPDLTVTSSILSIVFCYIIVFIISFIGNFTMFLILCR